jgi:hypothetical protein
MNEEFDERLKNRITDIFDNYEDDSAHEGWLLLRQKYPEEKKRRGAIWLWWGSAAAVLLVFLSIGVWIYNKAAVNDFVRVKQPIKNTVSDSIQTKQTTEDHDLVAGHNIKTNTPATSALSLTKTASTNQSTQKGTSNALIASNHKYIAKTALDKRGIKTKNTNSPDLQNAIDEKNNVINQTVAVTTVPLKQPESKTIDTAILANNTTTVQPKLTTAEPVKSTVKELKTSNFAALKPNDVKPNKPVDNKVKFGVYAATYINYSQGSDNQFNVGAGLSSEIKLAGNFKLSTGILIGQNSFNYKTAIPQTANNYIAASIAKSNLGMDASPATATSTGYLLAAAPANPVIRHYQANLLALDIPVNIKYQFAKSDTYISAGVSSGTYLTETYNFAYSYNSGYLASNDQQNTQTKNSFNTFDFAKTLNISFGTGYSLGKTKLIIEPFLKYPLAGLGSQNIKFGAGGLNLKLNFSPAKK